MIIGMASAPPYWGKCLYLLSGNCQKTHMQIAYTPARRHRLALAVVLALSALGWAGLAQAALQDEIQVYTDDINAPGERSLELHVNTTPSSSVGPSYPGESVNLHGLRITPEFAWGLTRTVEAGLYLPTVRDSSGNFSLAGLKLRLKWMPLQPQETAAGRVGGYAGTNFELSSVAYRFEEQRRTLEMRNIAGWRGPVWSFAVNPILRWGLASGYRGAPEFELDLRLMRAIGEAGQVGLEYYDVMGRLGRFDPASQRDRRAYVVWERDLPRGWALHLGAGRGFGGADKYTLKAIVSVPWP